jgi:hypothetical protein
MIDTLMMYGWNRTTHPYRLRQFGMYLLSLSMPLFLILTATAYGLGFSFQWHPIGLAIPALISFERAVTAHPRHRLLAALILPELYYDMRRSVWYWQALYRSLKGRRERMGGDMNPYGHVSAAAAAPALATTGSGNRLGRHVGSSDRHRRRDDPAACTPPPGVVQSAPGRGGEPSVPSSRPGSAARTVLLS